MIKKFILGLFILFFGVSFCYGSVSVGPLSFGSLGVNPNQSNSTAGIVSDSNYNFTNGIFTYTEQGERVFNLWWYSGSLKYTTAGASFLPSGNGTINGYFLCQVGYHVSMPADPRQSPICVFRNGFNDMGTYTNGLNAYSVDCAYGTCLLKMYKSGYYYNSEEVSSYAVLIGQYSGYQNVLGNDFLSLSDINYTDSPISGFVDYGGSNYYYDVGLTGDLSFSACTNGDVFLKLRDIFGGVSICYAGSYNTGLVEMSGFYDNYNYSTGFTFKEIYQLTNDGLSWSEWFNSNLYELEFYQTHNVAGRSFLGKPIALYTYFANLNRNGILYGMKDASNQVLSYCELALYSDLEKPYNGSLFSDYCQVPGSVGSGSDDLSGSVGGFSRDGVLSGADQEFDGTSFINSFSQKLKTAFIKPSGSMFGIVPNYILVFMFALILFRFLQH